MGTVTRQFITTGMHCPSCSMLVRLNVGDLEGVESVDSNHQTAMTEVTFDDDVIGPAEIIGAITTAGYGAELVEP